jgi:serine/threonine-protein kinase
MAGTLTKAGRYQIVSELGRGSMGVVYRGYDPVIGRTVAIKTMLVGNLTPAEFEEYKARFQREAQSAGALNHPNIVTVYDFGEDTGVLYLAMELLEGKSLQRLVEEQGVLPVETIVPIFTQVCSALDHAHRNKIVHRDIKPANIMIVDSGLVKVTDFGIAKVMSSGMTQAGQILGTPNYMSPEQVKGRPVDGRSDIFSLGVILYELVTGEKPFGGQNITTVIYKIINENPIPPRELDATIHPGLSYVIQKALAKSPEERYQTCRELAEDLKNYKNLGGTAAPDATVIVRTPPISMQPVNVPAREATPPPPPAPATRPAAQPAPRHAAPPPPRPYVPLQPSPSRTALWVVLALLLVGGLGGAYYYYQQALVPKTGHLMVNANVPDATISLDGRTEPSWVAPFGFSDLTPGPHSVLVSKEGYESARQVVEVKAGETLSVRAELKPIEAAPDVGGLTVAANIQGAQISLDGHSDPTWVTPYVFTELAAGEHALVISKDGYQAYEQMVTVAAGETASVKAELAAARGAAPARPAAPRTGQLVVTSNVPGAKISLDGRTDANWVTPFTFRDVSAGTHFVTVVQAGYAPFETSLRIEGGRTATVNANLAVPQGEINIVTTPPGFEVRINGKSYGRTPVSATLPLGTYTYELVRPGTEPYESSFELKYDGHMITRKVDLNVGGGAAAGSVIDVRTIPPGATVFANGKPVGSATPTSFRLSPGQHTLTISLSGFRPIQRRLIVPSDGSPVNVNERLSPQ